MLINFTYSSDFINVYNVLHTVLQRCENAHIICLFQHFCFIQLQYCQRIAEQDLMILPVSVQVI